MNNKPLKKNEVIKIFKSIKKLKTKIVNVNIENSNKCILAEDIISSINVPPFKNSAVDGYAIRNKDINYNGKFKIIEKILAGASLLQLYTGFVYRGPSTAKDIKKELIQILKADGIKNIQDAVGSGI